MFVKNSTDINELPRHGLKWGLWSGVWNSRVREIGLKFEAGSMIPFMHYFRYNATLIQLRFNVCAIKCLLIVNSSIIANKLSATHYESK